MLGTKEQCYICGYCNSMYKNNGLHKHHIFYGTALRQVSEDNDFIVYLCPRHHNMSSAGVHEDRVLDLKLKQEQQRQYESTHSREDFMKLIGRNYLDD